MLADGEWACHALHYTEITEGMCSLLSVPPGAYQAE